MEKFSFVASVLSLPEEIYHIGDNIQPNQLGGNKQ